MHYKRAGQKTAKEIQLPSICNKYIGMLADYVLYGLQSTGIKVYEDVLPYRLSDIK